jgi:hypothetical protein
MDRFGPVTPRLFTIPEPSSIALWWEGITCLSDPAVFVPLKWIFRVAVAFYVAGIFSPIALSYVFFMDVALGALEASQGASGHSRQTFSLCLMGFTLASWVTLFLKDRGGLKNLLYTRNTAQDMIINWGRQMIVAAYTTSAVTKELNSEGLWFTKTESFVVSVIKAQDENVLKGVPIADAAKDLAQWMLDHHFVAGCMLLSGWLLEICAPLALLNRRMLLLMGVLYWIFHWLNGWFMGLGFPLNRLLISALFLSVIFGLVLGKGKAEKASV